MFLFSFFPIKRSSECSSRSSQFLAYVGYRTTCSTYTRIIGRILHHLIMCRICFWHFIGWRCQIVWWTPLFTIGWIDDSDITFKKLCASVASTCGNKMNCSKVKQFICPIRCPLNADRNPVSTHSFRNCFVTNLPRFCLFLRYDDYGRKNSIRVMRKETIRKINRLAGKKKMENHWCATIEAFCGGALLSVALMMVWSKIDLKEIEWHLTYLIEMSKDLFKN